jgi:hypothetical protein
MTALERLAEASALLRSVEQSEELTATQRDACRHIRGLADALASSVETLQEMDGGPLRADGGTAQPQTISEIISKLDTGDAVKISYDTPQSDVEQVRRGVVEAAGKDGGVRLIPPGTPYADISAYPESRLGEVDEG